MREMRYGACKFIYSRDVLARLARQPMREEIRAILHTFKKKRKEEEEVEEEETTRKRVTARLLFSVHCGN
jgi:hypothetical protein